MRVYSLLESSHYSEAPCHYSKLLAHTDSVTKDSIPTETKNGKEKGIEAYMTGNSGPETVLPTRSNATIMSEKEYFNKTRTIFGHAER